MESSERPADIVTLVRERQGDQSQIAFAARLGITQSELSRFLAGKKGLTRQIAAGLIRAFPDLRDTVVDALVAEASAA